MSDRDVAHSIIAALAEYMKRDPASIDVSHHLRDDLGLDSMAVIELLYKIEEAFDLQIPDQDLPRLTTVAAVAKYVEQRMTADKPATRPTPRQAAKGKKKR